MKNLLLLGLAVLAGYLVWMYFNKRNISSRCSCGDDRGLSSTDIAATVTMQPTVSADVQTYETSPLKTFNAPARLIAKSNWPTDNGQAYTRG